MSSCKAFVLLSLLAWCSAYNIDVKTSTLVFEGLSADSLFGYSLTLHTGKFFSGKPTIFVGAPLGDVDGKDRGELLQCPVNEPKCTRVTLDSRADVLKFEHRDKQWLGATVFSNRDGPVIACAPRYSEVEDNKYFMVGKCQITAESGSSYRPLYPCTNLEKNHLHKARTRFGFCQTGMSATLRYTSKTAVMGAVGGQDEEGTVFSQDNPQSLRFTELSHNGLRGGFYFGYAVTYGNFYSKNTDIEDIAASVPRIDFTGKVHVYHSDLKYAEAIRPPPKVEQKKQYMYFGASICAVDVNGDGFADLIIGAPFYSDKGGDEGRVYVYLSSKPSNSGNRMFVLASSDQSSDPGLRGSNTPGARFGWAITKAGDLNFDGYDDFIVGAPQDQPDLDGDGFGNGAIYIYHGKKDYKMDGYKQKITAKVLQPFYNKGFKQLGYSIAGNVDTNDDDYPDIAIGAWDSNRVILLRTRPVMYMRAALILSRREIPVDNFTANCPGNSTQQCLDVEVHFSYYGKSVNGNQTISYTFDMDTQKTLAPFKRVYYKEKGTNKVEGKVVLTRKNVTSKVTFSPIYVEQKESLTEDLSRGGSDIVFQLKYQLISPPECQTTTLCPVLDESQSNVLSEKAMLVFNCSDNRCDHDLKIDITLDKKNIIIGKTENIIATIELSNKDEISYNPEITITHDVVLQYEKFTLETQSFRVVKDQVATGNAATFTEKFKLQGPLDKNKKVIFKLQYSTKNVKGDESKLSVHAKVVGQSGSEKNEKDNNATATVSVEREVKMEIKGISRPKLLNYPSSVPAINNATFNASDIGPSVKVTFELENKGASDLKNITFIITYPSKKLNGNPMDYIIYPTNISEQGDGKGKCETTGILDPENLASSASNDARRRKRDVEKLYPRTTTPNSFECKIEELKSGQRFTLVFELRLWLRSLVGFYSKDIVVRVEANARYPDSLRSGEEKTFIGSVDIHVSPENMPGKSKSTPVWVIIVSVLGGVLLLALAILALFKLGFFKRNRPPKEISPPQTDDAPPVA